MKHKCQTFNRDLIEIQADCQGSIDEPFIMIIFFIYFVNSIDNFWNFTIWKVVVTILASAKHCNMS